MNLGTQFSPSREAHCGTPLETGNFSFQRLHILLTCSPFLFPRQVPSSEVHSTLPLAGSPSGTQPCEAGSLFCFWVDLRSQSPAWHMAGTRPMSHFPPHRFFCGITFRGCSRCRHHNCSISRALRGTEQTGDRSKRGQRNAKGHPRQPFLTAEAKGPGRVCGDHPALWSDLATFVYLFEKES